MIAKLGLSSLNASRQTHMALTCRQNTSKYDVDAKDLQCFNDTEVIKSSFMNATEKRRVSFFEVRSPFQYFYYYSSNIRLWYFIILFSSSGDGSRINVCTNVLFVVREKQSRSVKRFINLLIFGYTVNNSK